MALTSQGRSALIAVFFAACAARSYRQPGPSEPHALLEIRKGEVAVSVSGRSSDEVNLGMVSMFNDEESVRVTPGKVLFLLATATISHQMMGTPISHRETCSNVVSFLPETGRVYELRQSYADDACRLDVIDASTREPPASLERHAALGLCAE